MSDGDQSFRERAEYGIFNALSWYLRAVPDWAEADSALAELKVRHPQWEAREYPDLDVVHWSGTWEPSVPATTEDWLERMRREGPSEAIDWLLGLDFSERQAEGPDWFAAQTLVRSAVESEPSLGLSIWDDLRANPRGERDSDVLAAVVDGWAGSEAQRDWPGILDRVTLLVGDENLDRPIADVLLAASRDEKSDPSALDLAREVAQRLVGERASAFTYRADSEWSFLGLNSWPGSVARFWVTDVSRRWRAAGEDWSGLDQRQRDAIAAMVSDERPFGAPCRSMFGSDLYFLFSADESFAREHLLPQFSATLPDHAAQSWGGYLYHPRVNDRMLEAGFLEIAREVRPIVGTLESGRLVSQYFSLLGAICLYREVSDEARNDLVNQLIVENEEAFLELLEAIENLLSKTEDPDVPAEQWRSWLGPLYERRLNGLPREPSLRELQTWADLALFTGSALPEAVAAVSRRPIGFGSRSAIRKIDERVAERFSDELIDYLRVRVSHSGGLDLMVAYRLRQALQQIARVSGRAALDSVVSELVAQGNTAAQTWLADLS